MTDISPLDLGEAAKLSPEHVLARLGSSVKGLTEAEAEARLAQYGANTVAREVRKSPARRLLELLFTPLSLLLLALAAISFLTGETKGAVVISIIVVLSSLVSFLQEFRSSKAAEKLRAMVSTTATVLRRDGRVIPPGGGNSIDQPDQHASAAHSIEMPISGLVPGEVIRLSAGDMIPADARVLDARDLFVNQAALTGEAMPVEKFATCPDGGASTPIEYPNLCFMGSNVLSGTASAVVVATGGSTYFGKIASSTAGDRQPTDFDRGMTRYVWLMLRFMAVTVPLVFLINGLSKGNWLEAFMFSVAVAVGLAPEMLPMIVMINLAKGAMAMSGRKVIVKRLASIQTFGAIDVLCTDKTGTLTQDRVIMEQHVDIFGEESERVLQYAYLNSFYQSGLKNLLDVAVLERRELHEHLRADSRFSKIDEIPFDFQRRRMSVIVAEEQGKHILICKGAVEEIFSVCTQAEGRGELVPLEAAHCEDLLKVNRKLNETGFRVIAVAYKEMPGAQKTYRVTDESDLILVGYIAFLDPPKESAGAAIAILGKHGVGVKILTGDNEVVTRRVCRQVGLEVHSVLLDGEIDALSDEELAEAAERCAVFAKLSPQQKARLITALQRKDHVVGFLGDGINDGPALKAADVGISVDGAVDIAKESADIILLEKDLRVLDEGVLEGRKVFGNIIKYIKMGASSNFGNAFSVIGASALLPFLPMAPVQILFNNLLYDFSQTTVATDQVDQEYLERPRKWDIAGIGRFMLFIGPLSSVFDYVTFFAMLYAFDCWNNPALFQTGWFVESLLSQTLIVHVIRTGRIPLIQSRASYPLVMMTAAICMIGLWLPFSFVAHAFGFVPPPPGYWLVLAAILACYLMLTQLVKTRLIKRFGLD